MPAAITIVTPVMVKLSGRSPNMMKPQSTAQNIDVYSKGATKDASAKL